MLKRIEIRDRVTNEPLPYVVVTVNGRRLVTDEAGKLTLDIPEEVLDVKPVRISVRAPHYEPLDTDVIFKRGVAGVVLRIRPEVL